MEKEEKRGAPLGEALGYDWSPSPLPKRGRKRKAKRYRSENAPVKNTKGRKLAVASVRLTQEEISVMEFWRPKGGSQSAALRAFLSYVFKDLII